MRITRFASKFLIPAILAVSFAAPAQADDVQTPYWASIRSDEVNMRVGPGEDYRIAWVYRRAHLPMKVLRIKEGWRFVQDPDGARGWVLARFLSRERAAYVTGKGLVPMRESASPDARLLWNVEPGVNGLLGDCKAGWCAFAIGPHKGFVEQSRLWGAGEP